MADAEVPEDPEPLKVVEVTVDGDGGVPVRPKA
jgi:hypothetical protein